MPEWKQAKVQCDYHDRCAASVSILYVNWQEVMVLHPRADVIAWSRSSTITTALLGLPYTPGNNGVAFHREGTHALQGASQRAWRALTVRNT